MRVRPVPTMVERRSDGTAARSRQGATRRRLLLAALLLVLPQGPLGALSPGELVIETKNGRHPFRIELADTPTARAQGLMFRESMPADQGMLFDFQVEQPVAFWMKNTPLPLDMLFIDGLGIVVKIAADTTPYSEAAVPSGQPIRAVLELNAGTAKRLGIEVGARVRHPIFPGG